MGLVRLRGVRRGEEFREPTLLPSGIADNDPSWAREEFIKARDPAFMQDPIS
jgi:hypothetical protein